MESLVAKLWNDDVGALIATEYLFVATIVVIGTVVGLTNLSGAINAELSELANALLAQSQGYSISGVSGCSSSTGGSQAIDTAGSVTNPTATKPSNPSLIDAL